MKAYLGVTAIIFGLLTVLHVWRMLFESTALMRDPLLVSITIVSAVLCVWAVRLLLTTPGRPGPST
jgi:hypothetical protein